MSITGVINGIVDVFAFFFFFQAEDGIRDVAVTGVQTCALPILYWPGGICRKLYSPLESVVRVMCAPVALLSSATRTFGTTPPEGSVTAPRREVSAVCDDTETA